MNWRQTFRRTLIQVLRTYSKATNRSYPLSSALNQLTSHIHPLPPNNQETRTPNHAQSPWSFFKDYSDSKQKSGEWSNGSLKEATNAFNLAFEILDDKPIDTYTREDARKYRDTLLKLPSRRKKRKAYKDKTIQELLKMDIPEEHRVKSKTTTLNRYPMYLDNVYFAKECLVTARIMWHSINKFTKFGYGIAKKFNIYNA